MYKNTYIHFLQMKSTTFLLVKAMLHYLFYRMYLCLNGAHLTDYKLNGKQEMISHQDHPKSFERTAQIQQLSNNTCRLIGITIWLQRETKSALLPYNHPLFHKTPY